jgi:hypothetical protein
MDETVKSNMLGTPIQAVTVFDTRRGIVTHASTERLYKNRRKYVDSSSHAHRARVKLSRNSAVQELLSIGWG